MAKGLSMQEYYEVLKKTGGVRKALKSDPKFKNWYEKNVKKTKSTKKHKKSRDTRSTEIKRILKKKYPNEKFNVKIEKSTLSESINVYTDLPQKEWRNIERALSKYKDVSRDQYGEILSGGNTFVFVRKR